MTEILIGTRSSNIWPVDEQNLEKSIKVANENSLSTEESIIFYKCGHGAYLNFFYCHKYKR